MRVGLLKVSGIEIHLRQVGIGLPLIRINLECLFKEVPRGRRIPLFQLPLRLSDRPLGLQGTRFEIALG